MTDDPARKQVLVSLDMSEAERLRDMLNAYAVNSRTDKIIASKIAEAIQKALTSS